jgi:hypothetical protein
MEHAHADRSDRPGKGAPCQYRTPNAGSARCDFILLEGGGVDASILPANYEQRSSWGGGWIGPAFAELCRRASK